MREEPTNFPSRSSNHGPNHTLLLSVNFNPGALSPPSAAAYGQGYRPPARSKFLFCFDLHGSPTPQASLRASSSCPLPPPQPQPPTLFFFYKSIPRNPPPTYRLVSRSTHFPQVHSSARFIFSFLALLCFAFALPCFLRNSRGLLGAGKRIDRSSPWTGTTSLAC